MNPQQEMSLTNRSSLDTADTWGFAVVLFALLADITVRSMLYDEAAWDLFAIIFLGGGVSIAHTAYHRGWRTIVTRKSLTVAVISGLISAIVAFAVAAWY